MTLRETVARAIMRQHYYIKHEAFSITEIDQYIETRWQSWLPEADAAIRAMFGWLQEPSQGMLKAGCDTGVDAGNVEAIFNAMIAAAEKETQHEQ